MNRPTLPALCAAALSVLLLPACTKAPTPDTTPPTATQASPESGLAACLARISELEQTLLTLKEESFISRAEYEARIKALLAEISLLESRLELSGSTMDRDDLPVGGSPSAPAETPPSDEPSATMAFHYEIRDGRAVILAYLGSETRVTVPAAIEGYPVTAIEDSAFQSTAITEVTVPCSVTTIGWFAFADCPALASVTLPASVESIGYGAFDGCPRLTLYCPASSYAAQYAASFALRYDLT